ncbi:MAG: ergothioneine biosynthesis protein EgtB [Planctomycetota bacterium]
MTLMTETPTDARPVDGGTPPDTDFKTRYTTVRKATTDFCEPLCPEDFVVQTMQDVSPTKWHLAHTSWFFETFLLSPHLPGYREKHPLYNYLFNSYYVSVGDRHCRIARGNISRPTVDEVFEYRRYVDEHMHRLIDAGLTDETAALVELGLHHEQQHQELMVTDLKHVLSANPLYPVYRELADPPLGKPAPFSFVPFEEGVYPIGHHAEEDCRFCYDNETPRHRVFLEPFALADRPLLNADVIAFIEDGGYDTANLWLSAAWAQINADPKDWKQPLYWDKVDGVWHHFTLHGFVPVDPAEIACHLSYYEADAIARWMDYRLPTEFEWEVACNQAGEMDGVFADDKRFHPGRAPDLKSPISNLKSALGGVWEWTQSQYTAYPGYRSLPGAIGEYNGKFMANQFVLRGGSCATPRSHIRPTYRNFFPADARWQFSGARLAKSL